MMRKKATSHEGVTCMKPPLTSSSIAFPPTPTSAMEYKRLIDFFHYTEKRHSFVGVFKFVSTNEYIQIIFVSFETDE
jgi:hypothetical protein